MLATKAVRGHLKTGKNMALVNRARKTFTLFPVFLESPQVILAQRQENRGNDGFSTVDAFAQLQDQKQVAQAATR